MIWILVLVGSVAAIIALWAFAEIEYNRRETEDMRRYANAIKYLKQTYRK